MPDITISLTAQQAQKVADWAGPPPEGVSVTSHIASKVKAWLKDNAIAYAQQVAANAAYDAARVQGAIDFPLEQ